MIRDKSNFNFHNHTLFKKLKNHVILFTTEIIHVLSGPNLEYWGSIQYLQKGYVLQKSALKISLHPIQTFF